MKIGSVMMIVALLATPASALAGEMRLRRGAPPFSTDAVADAATTAQAVADGFILPKATIDAVVNPSSGAVRDCWVRHASRRARSRGDFRIDVMIDPTGLIAQHAAVMSGRPPRRLARCIDHIVAAWRFPMRRAYTLASIPFQFVARGGAGPYRSCWNPRGCPPRHEERE